MQATFFSEAMDEITLAGGAFTLTKQGRKAPVAASVVYDSRLRASANR